MITKDSWKTLDMPDEHAEFLLDISLTDEGIQWLKKGVLPKEMEDKWFIYSMNDTIYFHRSWTGYCIYIVKLLDHNHVSVTVNRNPEQYFGTDIEKDKKLIEDLLYWFARIK